MTSKIKPVFVVSTGRSGSEMIAQLFRLHPAICAFHEPRPHLNWEAYRAWSGEKESARIVDSLKRKRSDSITQIQANGFIYLESAHYCSHLILYLSKLYDAKFIHIYRHGAEFVRSGLQRNWYTRSSLRLTIYTWIRRTLQIDLGNPWIDHRLDPPTHLISRLAKIAWLWNEINSVILRDLSLLPKDQVYSLRLEELDESPLVSLHDFIGITHNAGMTQEMLKIARSRPNQSKEYKYPHYRDWTEEEKLLFNRIAGEMMLRLGYEKI